VAVLVAAAICLPRAAAAPEPQPAVETVPATADS
jgi:hypothetical protein